MNYTRFSSRLLYNNSFLKPLPLIPALYWIQNKDKYASFLEMPGTEVWIRGEYENKIRRHSSVEKIFEVFATKKNNRNLLMTFEDLLRAIVPFNYSTKSKEEISDYFKENPPLFIKKLFDFDSSGDISIIEYSLFFLFHEVSMGSLTKHFRGGEINPGADCYNGEQENRSKDN